MLSIPGSLKHAMQFSRWRESYILKNRSLDFGEASARSLPCFLPSLTDLKKDTRTKLDREYNIHMFYLGSEPISFCGFQTHMRTLLN